MSAPHSHVSNPLGDGHSYLGLVDHMGSDLDIARAAWVSRQSAHQGTDEEVRRVLKYMYSHGHTSPFEQAIIKVEVTAPIFVLRQWHRHRTWSYNEESRRYTDSEPQFYTPLSARGRSATNKQGSDPHAEMDDESFRRVLMINNGLCLTSYNYLLAEGVAPELARVVLPVNTYSTMIATVDLHNLMKFIQERSSGLAQLEIRKYSDELFRIVKSLFPITGGLLEAHLQKKGGYPVVG